MSDLVASLGTSHTMMLAENHLELWKTRQNQDRTAADLVDHYGKSVTYYELALIHGDSFADQLTDDVWDTKWRQAQAAIQKLRSDLFALEPDLLLIIGDDQRELFYDTLQPAIAVFMGETVKMSEGQVPHDAPPDRVEAIKNFLKGLGCYGQSLKGAPEAGLAVVQSLVKQGFDVTSMAGLPGDREFGHAFGFVLGPLIQDKPIASVPIMLNTYFPPNQPTSARCYDLGVALANAVADIPGGRRVALVGSGGLSHFVIDEEIDRSVLKAFETNDVDTLRSVPEDRISSGTSEIRNWLVAAGAGIGGDLTHQWQEYIPAYRSLAGTGVGISFALWS